MTAPKQSRKFQNAVSKFKKSADWLGDSDLPALVALETLAVALDGPGPHSPALVGQYRLLHKQLLEARTPRTDDDDDDWTPDA